MFDVRIRKSSATDLFSKAPAKNMENSGLVILEIKSEVLLTIFNHYLLDGSKRLHPIQRCFDRLVEICASNTGQKRVHSREQN